MNRPRHDWYLKEWLDTLECTVTQLRERTEWTHRIASQLVNRKPRWNRDHLSQAATALHLDAWELLMHPSDAMEVRQLRSQVLRAAEKRTDYAAEKPGDRPDWAAKAV
jgi:transcriptional regulator with PAS, ATPase and Fis domain